MQREGHLNTEWNMKYDFLAPEARGKRVKGLKAWTLKLGEAYQNPISPRSNWRWQQPEAGLCEEGAGKQPRPSPPCPPCRVSALSRTARSARRLRAPGQVTKRLVWGGRQGWARRRRQGDGGGERGPRRVLSRQGSLYPPPDEGATILAFWLDGPGPDAEGDWARVSRGAPQLTALDWVGQRRGELMEVLSAPSFRCEDKDRPRPLGRIRLMCTF